MGLDDLIDNENINEYPIGSVKTRKKATSIEVQEDAWMHILGHHPSLWAFVMFGNDESTAKKLVQMMDVMIKNEVDDIHFSEQEIERIVEEREEIVNDYL